MSPEKFGSRPDESLEVSERISTFRAEASKRFQELLNSSHKSLSEIAELLDAKEFLSITPATRSQAEARSFNVASYLDREIAAQTFILPPEQFTSLEETVLPPDEGEILTGSGKGFEQKEIIPRSRAMVEVLSELKLSYSVIEGQNDPDMMRALSYKAFLLPAVHKIALVNDEEGNATFLVYDIKDPINEWQVYINQTKDQLKDLPEGKVATLIYPGDLSEWKIKIKELLSLSSARPKTERKEKAEEGAVSLQLTENVEYKVDYPPEGWVTGNSLMKKVHAGRETIIKIADQFRETNPEWFRQYLAPGKILTEHYSPELVSAISCKLSLREVPPPGWIPVNPLARELKVWGVAVSEMAEQFRRSNPEWFRVYYSAKGRPSEYFAPELAIILREKITIRERSPMGWMSVAALKSELQCNAEYINTIADKFRESRPELFHNYYVNGRLRELFSPELVAIIRSSRSFREEAPLGWMTNREIVYSFGIAQSFASKIAEEYNTKQPGSIHKYSKPGRGHTLDYYSPELITEIRVEFAKRENTEVVESEWKSLSDLSKASGVTRKTIARIIDAIQKPEGIVWSEEKLHPKAKTKTTYYSPEFSESILGAVRNKKNSSERE